MTQSPREQRDEQSVKLAEINRRNRDAHAVTPLPQRAPSQDGRSVGGIVDEKFGRK